MRGSAEAEVGTYNQYLLFDWPKDVIVFEDPLRTLIQSHPGHSPTIPNSFIYGTRRVNIIF